MIGQKLSAKLKGIKKVYHALTFKPYIVKKNMDGVAFDFLIGDAVGEEWYKPSNKPVKKEPDSQSEVLEMAFIKQNIVRRGDVVFECGGHHGMTAILLSNWVGNEGLVVTFEPVANNVGIIKRNISLNNLENVVVEHKGVGFMEGKVTFYRKSNSSIIPKGLTDMAFFKKVLYGGEEVEVTALDSYADRTKNRPNLLKIDVEGYEVEVLKGAKNILQKAPKICIEVHTDLLPRYGTSVKELLSLIDLSRYQCWVQWDTTKTPVPFDGEKEIDKRVHLFAIPK